MPDSSETRVRARPGEIWSAVALAVLTLVSTVSFAGATWWVLDLFSHFHAIYFWLAVVAAITLAALHWWSLATWAMVLAAFEAMLLLPLYGGAEAPTPGAPRLRALSYNTLRGNPRIDEAARHIAALAPDVVILLELTPPQLPVFTAALPDWSQIAMPREDPYGIAIFSRAPLRDPQWLELGPGSTPTLAVTTDVDGRPVTVVAMHPPPPLRRADSHARDRMLRGISAWAAERAEPVLVMGDFNASPWSVAMREILAEGPLRSTQRFGLQGTWPSFFGALGVPMEHALVTGPLEPVAREIEPAFGSDHRMLLVELELR